MPVEILLTTIAGGVFVLLGSLHTLYTLLDIRRPRRFAPRDDSVRLAMLNSTVRLTRGRTSMWDAWLGFNLSHGVGAIVFGVAAIYLPAITAPPSGAITLLALAAVSLVYLVTAVRFWFYIPIAGTTIAFILFLSALSIHLASGR